MPEEQRQAVAGLIDLKVESDMEKVLYRLERMKTSLNARMDSMETALNSRMDGMESKFSARFESVDAKIQILFWAMGLMATILLALLSKLLFGS